MVQGKHGVVTKQRLSVSLDKDVVERLDNYCKSEQRVRSLVIEKAIQTYLDSFESK